MPAPAKLTALVCALALLSSPVIAHANEAPPTEPPAPCVEDSLSMTGSGLWRGLKDSMVVLALRNGAELRGTIVAQDADQLAVARASDGSMVSVPKREIQGVRLVSTGVSDPTQAALPPVEARPTDDGRKLYGSGVTMLSFGIPLGASGTILMGLLLGAPYVYLPVLLPGIGLIIGGSLAIKRSHQRHAAYRKAWGLPKTSKLQLAPTLNLGREGGQVGMVMRF